LARVGIRALSFGIAAVALGFILKWPVTQPDPSDQEMPVVHAGFSVFAPTRLRSQPRANHLHVASLDPQAGLAEVGSRDLPPDLLVTKRASFNERFASLAEPSASFDERFGSAKPESTGSLRVPQDRDVERADRSGERQPDAPPLPPVAKRHIRPGQARTDSTPTADDDGHTAIYDISAHVVYLPNGRRLEAHSGLGKFMDSPSHVHLRMRGATPPNVYKLALRERLFHGVRALRLTPLGSGKMYGRAGILAHTYMLGPNGQSNGCVSFKHYPEFLNAYLKGEITRLAVVEHLDNPPGPKFASGWLPDVIRNLFKPSDSTAAYAEAR
jgi:hypothetical protein